MPKRFFALCARNPTMNRTRFYFKSSARTKPEAIQVKESAMIELIATNDSRAERNKNNVLALYDLMINQKRSEEVTAKFVGPSYIQHNPLIPDGSVALGRFFGTITRE